MSAIRSLERHLRQCASNGSNPNFAAADAKLWFLALSHLVAINALDVAAFAAPRLRWAFPAVASFKRTALLLERLPPPVQDAGFAGFVNDDEREVQIVPLRGAKTVVLAFTGRYGGLGLPVPVMHRWFGEVGTHVIYLRDHTDRSYLEGIRSIAPDRAGTVAALRQAIKDLRATNVACYGNSTGGYGALLYALDLPAAAVLAFGAVTEASPAMIAASSKMSLVVLPPLRPAFQAAAAPPKVRLVFGALNEADATFARHLEGAPGVTLDPVWSWKDHDAQVRMIEDGRMLDLLKEMASS